MDSAEKNIPDTSAPKQRRLAILRKCLSWGIRFIVPVAFSVLLLVWLFHKVNFHSVMHVIRYGGVNYWLILLIMIVTAGSHMIRGYRWGFQLRAVGAKASFWARVCSIWGAYALNLLLNQVGEAWRCIFIARRTKTPLSTVIGTDVGDRSTDTVVVLSLLVVMLCVARKAIHTFMEKYSVGRNIEHLLSNPWFWIAVVGGIGAIVACCYIFRKHRFMHRVNEIFAHIWDGFKVLFTMNHKLLYVVLTLGIWTCYFMETYICFAAFPFTRHAFFTPELAYGFLPGLVCFVFCAVSMAIPSNGGLGPWNIAMIFGLSFFGIDQTEGAALAMLMWSAQAATYIILGIISLTYVMITDKADKLRSPAEDTPPDSKVSSVK